MTTVSFMAADPFQGQPTRGKLEILAEVEGGTPSMDFTMRCGSDRR